MGGSTDRASGRHVPKAIPSLSPHGLYPPTVIDNQSHQIRKFVRSVRLTALPLNQPAYVDTVDWAAMSEKDGKRLREFGLCEGVGIELLHRAGWLRPGAHACRVGRMIVAMRAGHAAAISVRMGPTADGGVERE